MFKIGQKLEACEARNPIFVCPATVRDVRDDKVGDQLTWGFGYRNSRIFSYVQDISRV